MNKRTQKKEERERETSRVHGSASDSLAWLQRLLLIAVIVEEIEKIFVDEEILQAATVGSTVLLVVPAQAMVTTHEDRCWSWTKFGDLTRGDGAARVMIVEFHGDATTKSERRPAKFFREVRKRDQLTFPVRCDAIGHRRRAVSRRERSPYRFDRF